MNVISFSLYGDALKYRVGMLRNIDLAAEHYPGWIVRIYAEPECAYWLGRRVTPTTYERWAKGDAFLHFPTIPQGIPPMMWRFLVADDPEVTRFIVRDADSRIGAREARAVEEWIAEDTVLHVMRDHPAHGQPMMGGMWGGMWRRPNWAAPNMEQMIRTYLQEPRPFRTGEYADDQNFLHLKVWPWAKNSCTQHASVCREAYPGAKPFPTRRDWPRFVGEVFDEQDQPRDGDWQQIRRDEE